MIFDEDVRAVLGGRLGRDGVVGRLAKFVFVKIHTFEKEGQQPEDLTVEEVSTLFT